MEGPEVDTKPPPLNQFPSAVGADFTNNTDAGPAGPSNEVDGSAAVVLVASLVVIVQAAHLCDEMNQCDGKYAYAVAGGVISLVACIGYMVMVRKVPDQAEKYTPVVALFLLAWWTPMALILTFSAEFEWSNTGNGYFAVWLAFFGAIAMSYYTVGKFRGLVDSARARSTAGGIAQQMVLVVGVASVVEVVAAAWVQGDDVVGNKDGQVVFAIVVGSVSIVVCALYLFVPAFQQYLQHISAFLTVWWLIATGVTTFDYPFVGTGNGFFASWIAFLSSAYLAYAIFLSVTQTAPEPAVLTPSTYPDKRPEL